MQIMFPHEGYNCKEEEETPCLRMRRKIHHVQIGRYMQRGER